MHGNTMIGKQEKKRHIVTNGDDQAFANELNEFYARFETSDFLLERDVIRQQQQYGTPLTITADEVHRVSSYPWKTVRLTRLISNFNHVWSSTHTDDTLYD